MGYACGNWIQGIDSELSDFLHTITNKGGILSTIGFLHLGKGGWMEYLDQGTTYWAMSIISLSDFDMKGNNGAASWDTFHTMTPLDYYEIHSHLCFHLLPCP